MALGAEQRLDHARDERVGGVPRLAMFDNPSTIVLLRGGKRLQSPELKALCAHYGFEAQFANPRSGNEKGGVESLVGWAERDPFAGIRAAASLHELNAQLLAECLADAQRTRRGDTVTVHYVGVLSDGWERGDPELLGEQMARLHRLAHRVVWSNPRRARTGFQPLVGGLVAALPHVDEFVEGHSIASLEALARVVGA